MCWSLQAQVQNVYAVHDRADSVAPWLQLACLQALSRNLTCNGMLPG